MPASATGSCGAALGALRVVLIATTLVLMFDRASPHRPAAARS